MKMLRQTFESELWRLIFQSLSMELQGKGCTSLADSTAAWELWRPPAPLARPGLLLEVTYHRAVGTGSLSAMVLPR